MKKILIMSIATFIATSSFANIQIRLKNITNDKQVFIASLQDGKTIKAINVGNYAIVPDSSLKGYPENSTFTVGIIGNQGSTVQYCTNENVQQFTFQYKIVTNNVLSLEQVGTKKIICKNLV